MRLEACSYNRGLQQRRDSYDAVLASVGFVKYSLTNHSTPTRIQRHCHRSVLYPKPLLLSELSWQWNSFSNAAVGGLDLFGRYATVSYPVALPRGAQKKNTHLWNGKSARPPGESGVRLSTDLPALGEEYMVGATEVGILKLELIVAEQDDDESNTTDSISKLC